MYKFFKEICKDFKCYVFKYVKLKINYNRVGVLIMLIYRCLCRKIKWVFWRNFFFNVFEFELCI